MNPSSGIPSDQPSPPPAADDAEALLQRAVPAGDAGVRLDVFLAAQAEVGSRSRAKELIDRGEVSTSAGKVKPGVPLAAGTVVSFRPRFGTRDDERDAPPPMPDVPVLFADAHLIVIDKPPTLAAHPPSQTPRPGAVWPEPTVSGWFAQYDPEAAAQLDAAERASADRAGRVFDRPGIVHRLDRETSGVMVVARTPAALEELRGQFKARTVEKEYRALAFGDPRFDSDWIERPLAPNPRQGDRMVVARPGEGKEASTYYEVLERYDGFALFRCLPRTGRTHQIRVHLTSIGHSLVGDRAYRSRNQQVAALPDGAPDPGRHCLHAFRLGFRHPRTGESLAFETAIPDDMRGVIDWLRAHRPPRR